MTFIQRANDWKHNGQLELFEIICLIFKTRYLAITLGVRKKMFIPSLAFENMDRNHIS